MRFTTTINNVKCMEWGLTLPEAFVFAWLYELPSWAKNAAIDGNVWYFASRRKACEELPLVTDREDTMYRHYKNLEEKGLIQQKKIDGNDYIFLTDKGKKWNENTGELGFKSERSEKNPTELGKISEHTLLLDNQEYTYSEFVNFVNLKTKKSYRGDSKSKRQFEARLKEGWKKEDFEKSASNAVLSDYHKENGFVYLTPEFFTRADKLNRFTQTPQKKEESINGAAPREVLPTERRMS